MIDAGGRLGFAMEALFHFLQQAKPLVELLGIDERLQVLDAAIGVADDEWLMPRTQEARAKAAAADADEVGEWELRITNLLRSDRANAWITEAADPFLVTGVQVVLC